MWRLPQMLDSAEVFEAPSRGALMTRANLWALPKHRDAAAKGWRLDARRRVAREREDSMITVFVDSSYCVVSLHFACIFASWDENLQSGP